jgi:hypothetical protein
VDLSAPRAQGDGSIRRVTSSRRSKRALRSDRSSVEVRAPGVEQPSYPGRLWALAAASALSLSSSTYPLWPTASRTGMTLATPSITPSSGRSTRIFLLARTGTCFGDSLTRSRIGSSPTKSSSWRSPTTALIQVRGRAAGRSPRATLVSQRDSESSRPPGLPSPLPDRQRSTAGESACPRQVSTDAATSSVQDASSKSRATNQRVSSGNGGQTLKFGSKVIWDTESDLALGRTIRLH